MSNVHQLLIREGFIDGGGLLSKVNRQSREMVGYYIFRTLLISNFGVELL